MRGQLLSVNSSGEEPIIRLVKGIRVDCQKPVVAGINGIAIGAGVSLAMLADMRIASTGARFHAGYARAGTFPDCGLSWTLPGAVGHERAMRFLLEQEMVSAEAALAMGLAGEVVAAEGLEEAFPPTAEDRRRGPARRETDQAAGHSHRPAGRPRSPSAARALPHTLRGLKSEDGREAVRAIFEKRKPQFSGR